MPQDALAVAPDALPDVPDFDSYPVRHTLSRVEIQAGAVHAVWDDGLKGAYHPIWLRENAPDPETTHPESREQTLMLLDIPEDLTAVAAEIEPSGALKVAWSTGGESRYHPGWLRAYTHGAPEKLYDLPERRSWAAEPEGGVPRFDGPAALADEAVFARWLEAIHVHGFGVLEGLPAAPEVIETLPAMIGPVRESNFGRVFDVMSKPDAESNAYTAMALPVHVDLATREYQPGLQFLHCIQNGADGGDTLLSDAFHLAERMAAEAPELYEVLTTQPIWFGNKAKDTDYRWQKPFVGLDAAGNLDEVRWSPWLRTPAALPIEQVERIYRALRHMFSLAKRPEFHLQIRLKPGDLLCFDNRRILHGRTGYDPATGERWLRGCYGEREELHSRLRILGRHRRAEEVRAGS